MDKLRVRVYDVHFGDAILISVPDKGPDGVETKHILIDFGNVSLVSGEGGADSVFEPVVKDIMDELDGKPLDLYVMTHEHLDHVQGPLYSALKLNQKLTARYAWLTASAARDYYDEDKHPDAKKKKLAAMETFQNIRRFCLTAFNIKGLDTDAPQVGDVDADPGVARTANMLATLLLNNSVAGEELGTAAAPFPPTNSLRTTHCVEFLREIAPAENTTYVFRGVDLEGRHPFTEAKFSIWAPEENTAVYYRPLQPMALGLTMAEAGQQNQAGELVVPKPPPGVDGGAFYDLVEKRRQGVSDNLLAIDAAANDTSVVFCMEWRGWKLLFPGDAELRSWRTMSTIQGGVLEPVHFLKIGHHGSSNATPMDESLDKILPLNRPDDRKRVAVVSTYLETYNNVPSKPVLEELMKRCDEVYCPLAIGAKIDLDKPFINVADRLFVDVEFEG
ncbi:MAG TPA: hypothetical protein VGE45_16855 [Chloroflexia bacterium]|jgi:beta-lactamase superfamily II metal-dependent hydrolase